MTDIIYDFGSGRSNPDTFPVEQLQQAAVDVIARYADELNDYPGKLGFAPLRQAMARREAEREKVQVNPDHIVLTNGSMQAVTLAGEALAERGDPIIVEEYSYPGTLSAYRSLGLDMSGIRLTANGMCLDSLEAELNRLQQAGRPAKFIYTISTYQNPTGFTMPKQQRLQMIEIARRYDVPIVEDNCYADVYYEGQLQPAIYALDDDPRHIYLCSLSKILAPGLRLGYFLARPPMLEKLLARRHDAGSNTLAAAIVAEFYQDGVWEHTRHGNAALLVKRDLVLETLQQELADLCVWSRPEGGLFIWMRMPDDVDRAELWRRTQASGFTYLPGAAFHYRGENVPYLRLAFGHLNETQIRDGIPVLARCLRESRTSNEAMPHRSLFADV
jgi:2-aminoadipate transaminase